ncbi:MAG TPA: hypothetical protein VGI64_09055 [Streptosporangiaceae bacterium]|jgi:hypothetical protein
MKRVALVLAVVSVLVLIDGVVLDLINYHPDDQNPFFGNPNLILSDGNTALIAGGLILIASALLWLIGRRAAPAPPQQQPQPAEAGRPGSSTPAQGT